MSKDIKQFAPDRFIFENIKEHCFANMPIVVKIKDKKYLYNYNGLDKSVIEDDETYFGVLGYCTPILITLSLCKVVDNEICIYDFTVYPKDYNEAFEDIRVLSYFEPNKLPNISLSRFGGPTTVNSLESLGYTLINNSLPESNRDVLIAYRDDLKVSIAYFHTSSDIDFIDAVKNNENFTTFDNTYWKYK